MKRFNNLLYISFFLSFLACKTVQKVPEKSKIQPVAQTPPTPEIIVEPTALSIGNSELKTSDLKDEIEKLMVYDSLTPEKALKEVIATQQMIEEAKKRGYDKSEDFKGEFETYRGIEAEKYLTDSTTIRHLLKETYQWMKEEVNASHIMFQLSEFADPSDTLAVYNKLLEIRSRIVAGENFADLAMQFSQDKKTSEKGGSLGWFTALKMLYPIEKASYNTRVGQVSMPFRTKSGFHILKVNNRRPYSGKLIVQHLAKQVSSKATELENQKTKTVIDSLYNRLKSGDAFEELTRKYSDDRKTKDFGGILKLSIGDWEEPFEEAAFALKEGDFSKPFRTSGGWHILKLVQKMPLESYEEILPKLKNKVTTDSRGDLVKENTIRKLKKQLTFVENEEIVRNAIAAGDSNLFRKKWNYALNDEAASKTIFSLWKKDFKGKDFYEYVVDRQTFDKIPQNYSSPMMMRSFYNKFVEKNITEYAEEHLEEINKDFRLLMNEYKSSILTMHLLNDLVYEKSTADTVGQRLFYEKNKEKYKMPERVFATIITAKDEKNIQKVRDIFSKGSPYQLKRAYSKMLYYNKFLTEITEEHKKTLAGLLITMSRNKDYIVEIGGHADTGEGDNASAERIEIVKKFLLQNGLPIERIIENDYVKTKIVDKFDWSKNQRVSFQFFSNAKKDVEKVFNEKEANAVSIQDGYFKKGDNKFLDTVKWEKGNFSTEKDDRFAEIIIEKIEPLRYKTLREARGEVMSDYQKFLEKQFKEDLERKYPAKFNEEEVQKALKTPK